MLNRDPVYIPSNLGPEWQPGSGLEREASDGSSREASREEERREARDVRGTPGGIRPTPA
jgi:hypothetical protein